MRSLLLFILAWLPAWFFADNITVGQAQDVAYNFFKSNAQTRSSSPQLQLVWNGEDNSTRTSDEAAFYVFNRTDAPGFVIVSGDDIAMPILGYSFTSTFKTEDMAPNLKSWMQMYRKEILDARRAGLTASTITRSAWQTRTAEVGNVVKQLKTAKWNQEAPYNKYTPEISGTKAATGCVATAMAIVMKYHSWPPKGVGTLPEYTYKDNSDVEHTIPGHDLGHDYLWDKMLMEYVEGEYTEEEGNAVAQLMYDCGIMVEMMYNTDGYGSSGAFTADIVPATTLYMQYDANAAYLKSSYYGAEAWMNMLRAEIDANRPVIYGGGNDKGEGHQFVFDGYTDADYFGVNWGWGGLCDGYYLLSSLEPSQQGTGGNSGGGFIKNQDAIFAFQPTSSDSKPYESVVLMKGNASNGTTYYGLKADTQNFKENTPFNIQFGFILNLGNAPFSGVAILSLYDKDGNLKEHISPEISIEGLTYGNGTGFPAVPCEITQKIYPLDYIAGSYHNNESTEWKRLYGNEKTTDMIVVREIDTSMETNSHFQYNNVDKVITITTLPNLPYTLTNADGVEATKGVTDETGIISIDTKALSAGTYQLLMEKDEYTSKSVSFIIGSSNE